MNILSILWNYILGHTHFNHFNTPNNCTIHIFKLVYDKNRIEYQQYSCSLFLHTAISIFSVGRDSRFCFEQWFCFSYMYVYWIFIYQHSERIFFWWKFKSTKNWEFFMFFFFIFQFIDWKSEHEVCCDFLLCCCFVKIYLKVFVVCWRIWKFLVACFFFCRCCLSWDR